MRARSAEWIFAAVFLLVGQAARVASQERVGVLGLFEGQSDVGSVTPPGTGNYDSATGAYTLTSAGANTWYHVDDFHYLWKKASGDLALTAAIDFPPHTYDHDPNPHRKGILMFRQTLDAGGIYAAVGAHGSGMTALQYRRERGANTQDIELNIEAPRTVRLEKRGDDFTLFLSMSGEPMHQVGASVTLHLKEPFYVGLGAVSHDVNTTDKVEFSHVTLHPLVPAPRNAQLALYSTLQTIQIEDQFRRAMVIRTKRAYLQSANWAPDGKSIYVHEDGHVVKIPYLTPAAGGAAQVIDTDRLIDCAGNYGLSPDGKLLAMSCAATKGGRHEVYVLPASGGGTPRKVTQSATSSFFHAWSPDSRTIAFTRGSADKADIFTIPVAGGAEVRLTRDTINDGPDYSPDGKFIYFDSSRSGATQIWRMNPDGSSAEQVSDDDNLNSSPHVSPDGKAVAFLSQPVGSGPGMGDAALKVIAAADGLIRTLVNFQGNRGSFSMYGWGDANHLAFVSYQMLPATDDGASQ
jgi:TolB protein